MRKSWGVTKPKGAMKVKAASGLPRWDPSPSGRGRTTGPSRPLSSVRRSKSVHVGTRKMVNYA